MLTYCFVFVCQQGELEIKALLLAASLKRFLRCRYELVAAIPIPEQQWGSVSDSTLEILAGIGVRRVFIQNPFGTAYPIGNKIPCLGIETSADKIIFLDSDILCLREFRHKARFDIPFNVKPADMATFTTDVGVWRKVYASCGLALPEARVFTTVSGELLPPYFNAGVIAIHKNPDFSTDWIACCRAIETNADIPKTPRSLDQIALPVALAKSLLPFDCLDESYNYPAHLKALSYKTLPIFCHYHSPSVIDREPLLKMVVGELLKAYPKLATVMDNHADWSPLLASKRTEQGHGFSRLLGSWRSRTTRAKAINCPEVVITGIPRSGTSYLCRQLHSVENCVVINEPQQIFQPLATQAIPWGVGTFYRELRRDILRGIPIENRLSEGEPTEDTAVVGTRTRYTPRVETPNFLLGTKNTLAYLARLPHLRRALPEAHFVACIRNPFDTIASWKTSFSHLAGAQVDKFPVGHSTDPLLSASQRRALEEISATENLAYRRAMLWRYLAELVLENSSWMTVVHYDRLVSRPEDVLRGLLRKIDAPQLNLSALIPSLPRSKAEVLDEDDRQAIRAVCSQPAAELGLLCS